MKRTRISVLLVIALLLQLYAPLTAGAPPPPAIRTIMVRLHTFNAGEQP